MEKRIAERIKELRTKREISQQALADKIGVSRVAVTKWESGDTQNLKLLNLTSLLSLFNVSFDYLVNNQPMQSKFAIEAGKVIDRLSTDDEKTMALHELGKIIAKMRHSSAASSAGLPDAVKNHDDPREPPTH